MFHIRASKNVADVYDYYKPTDEYLSVYLTTYYYFPPTCCGHLRVGVVQQGYNEYTTVVQKCMIKTTRCYS